MNGKPPVVVRVQGPGWEVVIEVPGLFGDAGGVAARLRGTGVLCRKVKGEVHVNPNHVPEGL